MFLAFLICARPVFSLKRKGHFSLGFCPKRYSGSVAGLQFGLGKAESIFSGEKDFRFVSADFPPAGGVWGGMRAGFGLGVFRNSAALKKE
jgi:hypothetical protein